MSRLGRAGINEKRVDALLALAANATTSGTVVEPVPFFVDPQNSTGNANDNGPGTAQEPLLTIAGLNTRLAFASITAAVTITILGDVKPGDAALNIATVSLTSTGSLTFQGTPQVVHTGTLTGATTAINPAAQQRQILADTALGVNGWAPFEGLMLRVVSGPNAGTVCNVVSHIAGTSNANADRPITLDATPGTITSGDHYEIASGSRLNVLSANAVNAIATVGVSFVDFTFVEGFAANMDGVSFVFRCTTALPVHNSTEFCSFVACYLSGGIVGAGVTLSFAAGTVSIPTNRQIAAHIEFTADTYVTGVGLPIGPDGYQNVLVNDEDGTGGVQVQDTTNPLGAIIVEAGGQLLGSGRNHGLIWGNGNTGAGMVAGPGATIEVGPEPPTVTGAVGDFGFTAPETSTIIMVARAWNDTSGVYTANVATTWANFLAAIGSAGLGGQAHSLMTNAHIIQGAI